VGQSSQWINGLRVGPLPGKFLKFSVRFGAFWWILATNPFPLSGIIFVSAIRGGSRQAAPQYPTVPNQDSVRVSFMHHYQCIAVHHIRFFAAAMIPLSHIALPMRTRCFSSPMTLTTVTLCQRCLDRLRSVIVCEFTCYTCTRSIDLTNALCVTRALVSRPASTNTCGLAPILLCTADLDRGYM